MTEWLTDFPTWIQEMLAHLKRLAITKIMTSSDVVQSKEYDNLKPWQGEPRSSLGIIELNGGHVTSLRNAPPSFKFNFYSQYFGLSFNFMFHSQYFGTSFKFQYISATRFHMYYINDLPRQKPPDQVARWYWPGIKVSTIFHCIVWLYNHVRLSTVVDICLAMEFQRYFDVLCDFVIVFW